jgi:hypothetical protein
MSVDLYLVPSGFRTWGDSDWAAFFKRDPESAELGRHGYVGRALAAVTHNLERGEAGSRFPMLIRVEQDDREPPGWDPEEVAALLAEVERARPALAALEVNDATLQADDDEVTRRVAEYADRNGGRPPAHLDEFYQVFFDVIERIARRALHTSQGIAVIA